MKCKEHYTFCEEVDDAEKEMESGRDGDGH
jgi:hypothetical protein